MAAQISRWPQRLRRAARFSASATALAAVIGAAGCSGGRPLRAASSSPVPGARAGGASTGAPANAVGAPTRAPGCSTRTGPGPLLAGARTAMTPVPGDPFGVAESPGGRWTFVGLAVSTAANPAAADVFRNQPAGTPVLARTVPAGSGEPLGVALTRDGRYLLAADARSGAAVIDARRAEQGVPGALLGTLSAPRGGGAIEVAVSPDNRFAFVSLEDSGDVAVFRLRQALAHGFGPADFAGTIPAGLAPVGLAVSPDGRWLYATSEMGRRGPVGQGTLTVIDVRRAETDPARSVKAAVSAGCSPVRVAVSADGRVVWVTARGSDALLGFSSALLRSRPGQALVARVRVGAAPVGLALVDGGARIVVADSNRFRGPATPSDLAVVSVPAALDGRPALLGYLRAGAFPREMALRPGGRTLYVSNFGSRQLEAVSVAGLP